MPFEQTPEMVKPWVLIASLATILAFSTIACLLILYTSAPVRATPSAASPSRYQVENEQVSPNVAEPVQTTADRRPAARSPATQTPAAQKPAEPARAEQTPSGPAAPDQNTDDPAANQIAALEQRILKARGALETIDARELLRRAAASPAGIPK